MNTPTEIRIYKARRGYAKRRVLRDWVKGSLFLLVIGLAGAFSVWMGVRP